ncbi:MAG TPA: hypothetical protein VFY18_02630 [Candidatus Limnocylindrales bacterium]|nr:hypothetical protein [Candidatus Limnocylindrales bacterium]
MGASDNGGPVVVRVNAARRGGAAWVAFVVAVFIGIAVVKPWPAAVREAPPQQADPTIEPAPTEPPSAVRLLCKDPVGWRVGTIEELVDGLPFSDWGVIEPVQAGGPGDPRIPFFVVASGSVTALGYCAPPDDAPPADARLAIFRLIPGRLPEPIRTTRLVPNPPSPLGGLYRPDRGQSRLEGDVPTTASWATGIYVFHVHAANGYERWFGADVRIF